MEHEFDELRAIFTNQYLKKVKVTGNRDSYLKEMIDFINGHTGSNSKSDSQQAATVSIIIDILNMFISMINSADDDSREDVQKNLGDLGLLESSINLLENPHPDIVKKSLQMLNKLFEGGNKFIQEHLLRIFEGATDGEFFAQVRNRLLNATNELRNVRRQSDSNGTGDSDQAEEVELQDEETSDFGLSVLTLLQLICQGQFLKMKDFFREQQRYTRSFNIVQDVAEFAFKIEKAFSFYLDNKMSPSANLKDEQDKAVLNTSKIFVDLTTQIFATLTEIASACPPNIVNFPWNFLISRV